MTFGHNVTVRHDSRKKKLIIEVDLAVKPIPSKTGKSEILASTQGNKVISQAGVFLGLNVYRPKK